MAHRIIYARWITDGHASAAPEEPSDRIDQIQQAVRAAVARLGPVEREVIERLYLQFEDWETIARSLQISHDQLERVHRRALKQLRTDLGSFVKSVFAVPQAEARRCCICQSPFRAKIDTLLAARDRRRPWRIITRQIRSEYGIRLKNYRQLITHQQHH